MSTEPGRRRRPSVLVPLAVLALAGVAVAVAFAVSSGGGGGTSADSRGASPAGSGAPTEIQGPTRPDLVGAERRDEADLLAAGPVDAPVVLVVFSDYQCPYCARWSAETLPSMMEHVEAGDLRIEWRDLSVFGPASERGARASYAAARQGAFWEYHAELFAEGRHRSEADLGEGALEALAADIGLDADRFAADMTSEETAAEVAANAQLGIDLGAFSTPAFILGGQPILGAQPSEVFLDALQRALDVAG